MKKMATDDLLRISLREKHDQKEDVYLFGSYKPLNVVIFCHPEPTPEGEPQRWTLAIRTYKEKDHE